MSSLRLVLQLSRPAGLDPNCLEELISDKASKLAAAEKAQSIQGGSRSAARLKRRRRRQEYTRDKYEKLVEAVGRAGRTDRGLIASLSVRVPCWRCVIECYVCPLINGLR